MENKFLSEKQTIFVDYLLKYSLENIKNLPSIHQIGKDLGFSNPCVREQIELARNLGLVSIQPRRGISLLPYKFHPAVSKSLYFAIKSNIEYFNQYSSLRNQIEKAYFCDSIHLLGESDFLELEEIINFAFVKLAGQPIQIPHQEHRAFHLKIYDRLNNVFVKGLLESYWDIYELIGLDLFMDFAYLKNVWKYHEEILNAIKKENLLEAYRLLDEHMDLIYDRKQSF
jgi:DNA-binding GntR family transcriptional regulator